MTRAGQALDVLNRQVVACRKCPRLVEWREEVAREKRAAFREQAYWGRPVPGFGDPEGRVLVVGLAPAAHGANRTGRMFTGDRSGEWLFRALHRAGFANQPSFEERDDGLELRDLWLTAAVRCAPPGNRPKPAERDACQPFLEREVATLLATVRVVVCLGSFSWAQVLRVTGGLGFHVPRPRPRFGHGAEVSLDHRELPALRVVGSYHPSQQNTFTGRLTQGMFDAVWERARAVLAT